MSITVPSAGGTYFNPSNHLSDLALLVEPKRLVTGLPDRFNPGETIDVIYADIAIFRDSGDIENQTPSEVLIDAQVKASILVQDIIEKGWMDSQLAVVVERPNRAYVWRAPTYSGAVEAVSAYVEKRDAGRKEAEDSFPFDE